MISWVTAVTAEENKAIPLSNAKEENIIPFREKWANDAKQGV